MAPQNKFHLPRNPPVVAVWFAAMLLSRLAVCADDNAAAESKQELLRDSAQVATNRDAQILLNEARQKIATREFDQAMRALDRVLSAPVDGFVPLGDEHRLVSARVEAGRLLQQLPWVDRQLWEQQVGGAAQQAFEAANEKKDVAALGEIATRYGSTTFGRNALRALAAIHFDRGHFAEASVACRRLIEHPLASPETISLSSARLLAAWVREGETDRARRWIHAHRALIEKSSLQIADEQMNLSDWLRQNCPQLASSEEIDNPASPPARSVADRLMMPSVLPAWEREALPSGEVTSFVNTALKSWNEQGVLPIWTHTPVVAGSLAVVRGIDDLTAYNVKSGEVVWQRQIGSLTERIADNPKLLENDKISQFYAEALTDRLLADSVKGSLTTDGQRVYGIVGTTDQPESSSSLQFGRRGRRPPDASHFSNRLVAWHVLSGEEAWSLEGLPDDEVSTLERDASKIFVHGPVLCRAGSLYVVASVGTEMRVVAVEASHGRVQWSLPLADVPTSSSMLSLRHQRLACPLSISDGILVCATSAGAVAALDLTTRTWKWAYRYERSDIPALVRETLGRWSPERFVRWWDFWRHSTLAASDGRVIVATPDSDAVRALDLETGEFVWERPRGDGLFLDAGGSSSLIVVGITHLTALDRATGKTRWSTPIGEPSARGALSGEHYLLPLRSGEFAAFRLNDGSVVRSNTPAAESLGNLVAVENGFISQTPERVACLSSLDSLRSEVREHLKTSPDDAALLHRKALLDREAGDFAAATSILRSLVERRILAEKKESTDKQSQQEARRALRETLLAEVQSQPDRLNALSVEIASRNETPQDRIEWLRLKIRVQRAQKQFAEAVESCFQLFEIASPELLPVMEIDGPRRRVRLDRLIQGELADTLAETPSDQKSAVDAVFHKHWEAAANKPDLFSLDRLAANVSGLRWEEATRDQLANRKAGGGGFLRAQLRLLEQTDSDDRPRAAASWSRLARLFEAEGYSSDAVACSQRLFDDFADVLSSDGLRDVDLIRATDTDSSLRREIDRGRSDPWGAETPSLKDEPSRYRGAEYSPLHIEAARGSLFDRVSVYLHVDGKSLRFQGDEYRTAWKLSLPEAKSSFRALVPLARGWGLGHLLILRLGTELFAISTLDERGEPEAKIRWRLDTADNPASQRGTIDIRLDALPMGFGPDEIRVVDRIGWTCGRVGPVRPAYLCYQEGARLVAVETDTGGRLWQRDGVPHDAICSGNERFVVLARPDSSRVEILRVADGKTVAVRQLSALPREFLLLRGTRALAQLKSPQSVVLESIELAGGAESWRKEFPHGSAPFRFDAETIGVLAPDGAVWILSSVTGREISRLRVDRPEQLVSIHSSRDDRRFYLAISGPVDPRMQRWAGERGEFRNPPMSGPLYALDRRSCQILWKAELHDEAFQLDQLHETPFLILNSRRPGARAEPRETSTFMTRLIDKGTGGDLLRDEQPRTHFGCTTVETSPDARTVDLLLPNKTVRLQYAR